MVTDANNYEINGKCYDFDEEGICLNPDGIVYSGWIQDGDHWLYYGPDSKMYKSSWHNINGKWYYFDYSGYMMTGLYQEWLTGNKSVYYYFNQDGAMITGWQQVKISGYSCWIYAGSDGVLYQNRWFNYNGSWYYFNGYKMLSGVKNFSIDGRKYDFDNSGKCTNPYNGRK